MDGNREIRSRAPDRKYHEGIGRHSLRNELAVPDKAGFEIAVSLGDWISKGSPGDFEPIDVFQFTTDHRAGYDWWSLQPTWRPVVPSVTNPNRVKTPIDAFVIDKLECQSLRLSPVAEPRHQIRRLYFDLIGLPPPAEVVRAFERNPADDEYSEIVDGHLSSPAN